MCRRRFSFTTRASYIYSLHKLPDCHRCLQSTHTFRCLVVVTPTATAPRHRALSSVIQSPHCHMCRLQYSNRRRIDIRYSRFLNDQKRAADSPHITQTHRGRLGPTSAQLHAPRALRLIPTDTRSVGRSSNRLATTRPVRANDDGEYFLRPGDASVSLVFGWRYSAVRATLHGLCCCQRLGDGRVISSKRRTVRRERGWMAGGREWVREGRK